ncbi:MAG: PepSY domain-containing protein [Methyloglobulus sp.]|nr:PepSY domain-containing protein [Methyloglobulus sp.]
MWSDPTILDDYSSLTIKAWLFSLHIALIWGFPYKIFVCLMGFVIVALSVTGVIIWWKKYRAAKAKQIKMASAANMPRLKN